MISASCFVVALCRPFKSDPKKAAMAHFRVDYTIYADCPQVKVAVQKIPSHMQLRDAVTVTAGTVNSFFRESYRRGKTPAH